MKKINKNYYTIVMNPYCTVFMDEDLMRKATNIVYKYEQEMERLLVNNMEHLIKHSWALANPNGKQIQFHSFEPVTENSRFVQNFEVRKVENLFDLEGADLYSEETKNKISELIEKEL